MSNAADEDNDDGGRQIKRPRLVIDLTNDLEEPEEPEEPEVDPHTLGGLDSQSDSASSSDDDDLMISEDDLSDDENINDVPADLYEPEDDDDDDDAADEEIPVIEISDDELEKKNSSEQKVDIEPKKVDSVTGLYHNVRPAGPLVAQVTDKQMTASDMVIDMAEHSFDLQVIEVIRLGDHVLVHGYDCCHSDASLPVMGVFKCYDCGLVAETVTHEWKDSDDLTSKTPRLQKLLHVYLDKPIDPAFK